MSKFSKYAPTWKWWTATITAAGTIAVVALTGDGINTDSETTFVIGIVVQRLVSYMTPNKEETTPSVTT